MMNTTQSDYQKQLEELGYVVFPTLIDPAKNHTCFLNVVKGFDSHFASSPEFKSGLVSDPEFIAVLGGFAATGNPSSFHHTYARRMREVCQEAVLGADVLPLKGRKLEQPFDRLMLRREGQTPMGESMHRDIAPTALEGDDVFGGWLNLDDTKQVFLCAPGTHTEKKKGKGFAKIKCPEELARLKKLIISISIPPGHMLIFNEKLVHKVASTTARSLTRRIFLGWRATHAEEPLFGKEQTLKWCDDQAVPKIKSAQKPRVWPNRYGNFPEHYPFLEEWSKRTFAPECLVQHTVKQGECKGTTLTRVHYTMSSLLDYKLDMHRPYDPDEKALLMPQYELRLRSFQTPGKRKRYLLPSEEAWCAYQRSKFACPPGGQVARPRPEVVPDDEE